jgi:CRISPR-associated protein Cas2
MRTIIAYDIGDNKRRVRLVKRLEGVADRVQLSVFEADLPTAHLQKLVEQMEAIIDPETDGVRIYRLCQDCASEIRTLGQGRIVSSPGVIIV